MWKKIRRFIKRIFIIKTNPTDIQYEIGNYKIWLPHGHRLPEFQQKFRNYDRKLKTIVESIEKFDAREVIIDIGANVGDTAAFLRSFTSARIVCIEGDAHYLEYLKRNSRIVPELTIVDSYVTGTESQIHGEVIRTKSSAKISMVESNSISDYIIETKTLNQILTEINIQAEKVQLIKIDTDGFDFNIISGNKQLIESSHPNLFFEYDITFNKEDLNASLDVISFLENNNYKFIIYDNFGNLLDYISDFAKSKFERLNKYLHDSRTKGGGIYHLDIFATNNRLIAEDVIKNDNPNY